MTIQIEKIQSAVKAGYSSLDIARQIYFLFSTHVFNDQTEQQFELYKEISEFFGTSFGCVHVVGSAKTGVSLITGREFDPVNSDLDIALIDADLYRKYVELSFVLSDGWRNRSVFPVRNRISVKDDFLNYLRKGVFRPDLMPNCSQRGDWLSFFGRLSGKYTNMCSNISACIYMSSVFFEWKQKNAVDTYLANQGGLQ